MDDAQTIACPACGRRVALQEGVRPAEFPFCCRRCRLVDLGAWFAGRHRIGGRPLTEDDLAEEPR